MEDEKWVDIKGFEGKYMISDHGNIMSMKYGMTDEPSTLAKKSHTGGYEMVHLSLEGSIAAKYVHRLVAEAFIPNPGKKPCVNHKDGRKKNNRVSNLEWVTESENMLHAYETGLMGVGARHPMAKLNEMNVRDIREMHEEGYTTSELADLFDITYGQVVNIVKRKHWTHIK